MRFVAFFCAQCGIATERSRSAVSRARKKGAPLFCGRVCAGLHRRKGKTIAEKKAEKAAYDAKYRELHSDKIKAQKAAHYRATYNPEKARYERKRRMPYHVEYCRKPEYRRYKQEYDTKYRASDYGEFADAYMILVQLQKEIRRLVPDKYERLKGRGYYERQNVRAKERRRRA